jgi:tRNA(Ile)-lysidine synthase
VLAYLESLGQAYLQDASNADITLTRNWIRHRLLPLLRAEFQPQVDDALLRLARQAAEAADVLEESAGELLSRAAIERQRDVVRLSCEPLAEAADIVIREAFRLLWIAQGWPRQRMGFTEWDALCALARRATGDGTRTLPQGVVAERQGGLLRLTYVGTTTAGDDAVSGLPDAGRP